MFYPSKIAMLKQKRQVIFQSNRLYEARGKKREERGAAHRERRSWQLGGAQRVRDKSALNQLLGE